MSGKPTQLELSSNGYISKILQHFTLDLILPSKSFRHCIGGLTLMARAMATMEQIRDHQQPKKKMPKVTKIAKISAPMP